jgi:hypothetical protein
LTRPAGRSLRILTPVPMSPVALAMVSWLAGGRDGGGAGGHGRLGWCPVGAGHGMVDIVRVGGAGADARLGGLGRGRGYVPPGAAGHQTAAARRGRCGMAGQEQQHPAGEGGSASDHHQGQVRLMPGQCVRPPRAGSSPVPRLVTGTMAHVSITPARSRPGRHCSSGTPGNSACSRPLIALACAPRPAACPWRIAHQSS